MLSIKLFRLVVCFGSIETSKLSVSQCFGIEEKKPKQTISKQRKNKPGKTGKTLNFLKTHQNIVHIKLFRLVFCLFRFNRSIENLCSV
jgi:hypothetical protein